MSPAVKRWSWRIVTAVATVVAVAAAVVAWGVFQAERKMQRRVEVAARPVSLRDPADPVLARGAHLFGSRGCADCHGANGAGRTFVDDPNGLRIAGPQIAPGPGSVTADYRPEDWERAIRHGVAPSGRPLMIMPSEDYNRFTDDDLAALVAYTRTLPPGPGRRAVVELPLPVRVLYGLGVIQDAAAKIDHGLPPSQPVPEGITVAYGGYVASMCIGCHGPALHGGRIPGGPPDWPPAPRLVPGPGSALATYSDADRLLQLFRTGKRPDGSTVKVMPFEALGRLTETETRALHLYLSSQGI